VALDTLVGTKLTEPIGSDKSDYNIHDRNAIQFSTVNILDGDGESRPPWAEAGSVAISRPKPGVKVLQWLRHAISNVRSRTLEQDKTIFAGFTCKACPQPKRSFRRNYWTGKETSYRSALLWKWIQWTTIYPDRCKECNTKYSRWKRAKRAMQKIHDRGMDIWFITLTRPNITGVPPYDGVIELDRALWIKDFKKFRRTKIWKDTFAGGYWFYEFTSRAPEDKIFARDGTFIRQTPDHEINGHLHILATSDGRIPMKELTAQWGDRVDFRQPKHKHDVMRYLRGYLIKCSTDGVNMRPFGDIHRRKVSET